MMSLFLTVVYMVDYSDRYLCVEPLLNLWSAAHLIMVNNILYIVLDSICEYFGGL